MDNFDLLNVSYINTDHLFSDVIQFEQCNDHGFFIKNDILYEYDPCVKSLVELETFHHVIRLKFLFEANVLVVATVKEVFLYNLEFGTLESCHNLPKDIEAISFDPSEEIAIIIYDGGKMVTYFVNLRCNNWTEGKRGHITDPVPQSVFVGWGSANTQFGGKRNATKLSPVAVRLQKLAKPKICWRGNGECFVVNFWEDHKRRFKVFDRFCAPLYESTDYPGLQSPISFKYQGNMIACAVNVDNVNKIVIFEKNCKEKMVFEVPDVPGTIEEVAFHPTISMLIVQSVSEEGEQYLSLYYYSNAKWYLKQQLYYPPGHRIIKFFWSNTSSPFSFNLHLVTSKEMQHFTYRYMIHRTSKSAVVALINGRKLQFTCFAKEKVPPPLYTEAVLMPNPINIVSFNQSSDHCAIIDNKFNVKIYEVLEAHILKEIDAFKLLSDEHLLELPKVFWNKNELLIYFNGLTKVSCTFNEDSPIKVSIIHTIEFCQIDPTIILSIAQIIDDALYVFTLNISYELKINDQLACTNVTSFYIYDNYLLVTTLQSELHVQRMDENVLSGLLTGELDMKKSFTRPIEPGGRITCVTPFIPQIVMEQPRGNLEIVISRVILIDMIATLLEQNDWPQAIHLIRIQRLHWNLLIDLDPTRFVNHIPDFVASVQTATLLNSICLEFSDENVLVTTYKRCVDHFETNVDKEAIFLKIILYLQELGSYMYSHTIVVLYLRHVSLKAALIYIMGLYESLHCSTFCKKLVAQVLLYSNVKDVYNEALILYNLEFARFIAGCCSIDPKVYESELDHLQKLSAVDLRFTLNVVTKNFQRAVTYLLYSSIHDEEYLVKYITKYNLSEVAYKNCSANSKYYVVVSEMYGAYLSAIRNHDEAGFVLKRAQLWEQSLEQYIRALNVQQVIYVMGKLNYDQQTKVAVINNLAHDLIKSGRAKEAARLFEVFIKDYERAVRVLVVDGDFSAAISTATMYGCSQLIDDIIKPSFLEYRSGLIDKVQDMKHNFVKHANRLLESRKERLIKLNHPCIEDFTNDLYSEVGSVSSRSSSRSKKSTMSSKNRRKEEKKKSDLREGGIYENIALIRVLYEEIVEGFQLGRDVREVCLLLEDESLYKSNAKLHDDLCDLHDTMRDAVPTIWTKEMLDKEPSTENEIIVITENLEHLDKKYWTPPVAEMSLDWKLDIFSGPILYDVKLL